MSYNMNKTNILNAEAVMGEIVSVKETVKETIRYWQKVLDELGRRAIEYEEIYKNMKEISENEIW
jgi:hypothetical protein